MDGAQEFAARIKRLEQELTNLKSGKRIISTVKFNRYYNRTLPETHNAFKITYANGDQPIITDIVGGRFIWMVSTPVNNTQYIKLAFGIGEAGIPNILSTREIVKVEAL